ncbi:SidA/IucD/PvdA family monooxygenase [Deinococcus soli (ex Cha et al. 2016)]|uniref:SidA/IucD/PvdA family monooxygenase n=1 Tax=Deinococcus soli (ex Cha et al. 2016) TaxID=1309411 RepID=UPI00166BB42A|nr:SidA/IucD/PvdA family monooxygenase [Deinococcus soli (ex Cha et al. 2016)]GGB60664.1 putative peptide monooxygenase [Deinococcus soli (ex Cha et al. 2016)]
MTRTVQHLGIGLGPANLALAVADLEGGHAADLEFWERQGPDFPWHPGMLMAHSELQISFLKDLATLRDPSSHFTFVRYLWEVGRLQDFINLGRSSAYRLEFSEYLTWARRKLPQQMVRFHREVLRIEEDARGEGLCVHYRQQDTGEEGQVRARSVILGMGKVPSVPVPIPDHLQDRAIHSHQFLQHLPRFPRATPLQVVVVGGGQSAAEVILHLHEHLPHCTVTSVQRRLNFEAADDSPFSNQVFDPAATNAFYQTPAALRPSLLQAVRNRNYAAVSRRTLHQLFEQMYFDQVQGAPRIRLVNQTEAARLSGQGQQVTLHTTHLPTGQRHDLTADVVIFATGYASRYPNVLAPDLQARVAQGPGISRDYRLLPAAHPFNLYVNGDAEASHGISDGLLSVVALRAGAILEALQSPAAARVPEVTA